MRHLLKPLFLTLSLLAPDGIRVLGAQNVLLAEVPDYAWHAGCFGTATGNLMGYWDRHGMSGFYTGPTASGVAPLNNFGANDGIRSMWASKAGIDGRPANQPGHIDDYWTFYADDLNLSYESAAPDPYITAGRAEHSPDCLSDFIGSSQNKWKNLNGECDGNIDAYAVTFWESQGAKRINYIPPDQNGVAVRDIPSGLRAWTHYRGYDCEVFSHLTDFNSNAVFGKGFSFADLKAEIDAGYPVMLFLQNFNEKSRSVPGMQKANPNVHGMLAFGYLITDSGAKYVRYKTSWGGSGDNTLKPWTADQWEVFLPLRGVIGYHPFPKITGVTRTDGSLTVKWDGPSSVLNDLTAGTSTKVHRYVLEQATSVETQNFVAVSEPTSNREITIKAPVNGAVFFRVRLIPPG
jgi:hypothetical protein